MSNKLTLEILHTSILEIHSARRHFKGFEKISSAHLVISKVKFNLLAWFLELVSLYPRDITCLWDTPITAVLSIYLIHPHFWAFPPLPPSSRSTLSQPSYLLCASVTPQLKSQVLTTVPLYREFFQDCAKPCGVMPLCLHPCCLGIIVWVVWYIQFGNLLLYYAL